MVTQSTGSTLPASLFWLIFAANAGNALEGRFRKWEIHRMDWKMGAACNIWIDYPQTLITGFIALQILGEGPLGYSVLAGATVARY